MTTAQLGDRPLEGRRPPAATAAPTSYAQIIRRRLPVIVAALGMGLIGAALVGNLTSEAYVAESTVALRPIVVDPFQPNVRPSDSIDLATEREQASSAAVIARAAELRGIDGVDPSVVDDGLEVSVVGDAQVLRIEYESARADDAQLWAAAITDAYLERRSERAGQLVESMVTVLDAQISELEDDLPDDEAGAATSGPLAELVRQRAALLSLPTDAGEVLRPATLPTEVSGAPPWVGQVGVVALALLAGFGAAVAIDRRDHSIRSAGDVSDVAGPLLGTLQLGGQEPKGWWRRSGGGSAPVDSPRVVQLRLNRSAGRSLRRLVMTSPHWGPPVGEIGSAIGPGLRGDGSEVLLVGSLPDAAGAPSLLDLAAGRASLDEAVRTDGRGVGLLDVGDGGWTHGATEALAAASSHLQERYPVVVVLAPPILERAAEGLELAADADAVVLVVDDGTTDVGELAEAVEAIDSIGARFAGTVLARGT